MVKPSSSIEMMPFAAMTPPSHSIELVPHVALMPLTIAGWSVPEIAKMITRSGRKPRPVKARDAAPLPAYVPVVISRVRRVGEVAEGDADHVAELERRRGVRQRVAAGGRDRRG